MPVFSIQHITKYQYDRPVKESVNEIKIYPYADAQQEILQHDILITGNPDVHISLDYWNNKKGSFNLLVPHQELIIDSRLKIKTAEWATKAIPGCLPETLLPAVEQNMQLLSLSTATPIRGEKEIQRYAGALFHPDKQVAMIIKDCCEFIYKQFTYIKGITTIESSVDEILEKKAGVCQDFAHVMLEILRRMGIPARYVSGYICPNKNGMRGEGATHAWVEAYVPSYGWLGVDPTNNVVVTQHHVKLAVGRDFNDCSPVKGTFKGPAIQSLSVYVSVGYEDGAKFEELNDVHMEKQNTPAPAILIDTFAGQQQ
jgi:transglutaminase-like putative cysteine protease